ncbi:MAG: TRAM domain-containing protein [Propionibacteriaceae bacterium]|nr:TRAM domain-containing protein [Propionibacteriaceae bacterium]
MTRLSSRTEPQAPDVFRLTTTDVAHGGFCVARTDNRVVFVSGALPDEVVDVEITARRAKSWYGRVVAVVEPSPDRVPHVWPLAAAQGIGGVDLGHVSLAAGRAWKARVVETQLRRLALRTVTVQVEAAPGDEARAGLASRTRVTLRADAAGRLGMYAAKSHEVVPVDGMPLAVGELQAVITGDLGRRFPPGQPRHFVQPSGSPLVVVGEGAVPGVTEVVTTQAGTWRYQVRADGFWQVHRAAPAVLVAAVLDAVGDASPAYDLYAGAGLFTQPLADRGPLTAIEGSPTAVADLRRNVPRGVTVVAGDVATVLAGAPRVGRGVIVCDPPRAGAGRRAVEQMTRLQPDRVVYVACDPAALARDVALFDTGGYELTGLRGFDLFPLTHHVECVAVLDKR